MDEVFKALADPTRRGLLDALYRQDGQSLGELERTASMSRFGIMKHLKVLETAGLVHTRKIGRVRHHHLNVVPIRLVHDRWVSKYAEPWAAMLSDVKQRSEAIVEKVFEIYIKATPERIWEAITDPALRARYNFGASVQSDWQPGSAFELTARGGAVKLQQGENVVVDPPRRLVQRMTTLWSDGARQEGTTRVTWEIEPIGDSCRLTVTHDGFSEQASPDLYGGWPMIVSGLKTLLETGEALTTPGSLMYAETAGS